MLSPASWTHLTEGLALGQHIRTDHDCGPGRTLTVRREARGLSAHCFRCNDKGWLPAPPEPLSVRLERLAKAHVADAKIGASVALPGPVRVPWSDWPAECRLWLLKAGLSGADAGLLGAYYHPPTDRVVLPVLGPSGPVFWQARAVKKDRFPKYVAPPVDKASVVPMYGSAQDVTLTEDILSAYKVGTVGEGWSLLGTSISAGCMAALLKRNARVNVWLDPDGAGHKGATRVLATLRGAGLEARRIISKADPKLIHRSEIKELLTWHNSK